MACPADPTWRKYLADRYAQYASIHPRRLWREDDFSKTPEEFLPHEKNWPVFYRVLVLRQLLFLFKLI
ncbi:hypothetical protein [Lactobacillus taiwanensis]|uniref:hypothetical protein n=1 Tax=Lactobacillus taiwanensis TaxID=508451 RepID=UPI00351618A4